MKKFGKRVLCASGCGTFVLPEKGECRKCRRKRVLAGKKIVARASGHSKPRPKFETAKEKFERVKKNLFNILSGA